MDIKRLAPWLGAVIGGFVGWKALEWLRANRQPCLPCRRAEDTGLAPVLAVATGAAAGWWAGRKMGELIFLVLLPP